ncbi:hypothetical protein CAPTEDRAFT_226282 [Capitella teleta]|uniref:Uncharacterized protein n=1 Tax=Capitella teleta TaxID=283909 RepID=R7TVE9_CAPTE|nr:hypothetical protein CAPTEDRAFT_226282 [Capitella teleta]|eukprot:ELT95441.1 hypothetical protein CAPTEDRAFT_226282 [Capitella teleta]
MAKYGFTWAVSTLTMTAGILTVISFIIHLAGFSCPEWWVGPGDNKSPFISIGWHEACFEDCRNPYCPNSHYTSFYDGCYKWTFNPWLWDDDRIRELQDWLMPDWYVLNRNLVIVGLPLGGLSAAIMMLCTCFVLGERDSSSLGSGTKDVAIEVLLYISSFLLLSSGIMCLVGVVMFYSNSSRLTWMPMPEKNHFGYSYWMVVASTVMYILAFFCSLTAAVFKTLRRGMQKDPRYSEEMMLGR